MKLQRVDLLFLFLFLLFILFRINFSFRDYGLTFDELDQMKYGQISSKYYSSFFLDKSLFNDFSPRFYSTHSTLTAMLPEIFVKLSGDNSIESYHLWNALLSLPAFIFVYLSVKLLTKSTISSLFSVLFLYVFPRFTGDIFNNSKDVILAVFLSIYTYVFLLFLKNKKLYLIYILGVLLGILISIKFVMVYVALISIIFLYFGEFAKKNRIKNIKVILVTSFIAWFIFSPQAHVSLFNGVTDTIKYNARYKDIGETLFAGRVYLSDNLPKFYLPFVMFITIPEHVLLFVLVSMIWLIFCLKKRFQKHINNLDNCKDILFILLLLLLPIIGVIVIRPSIYDMWRHFLFLSIPIVILSSIGFKIVISYKYYYKLIAILLALFGVY